MPGAAAGLLFAVGAVGAALATGADVVVFVVGADVGALAIFLLFSYHLHFG